MNNRDSSEARASSLRRQPALPSDEITRREFLYGTGALGVAAVALPRLEGLSGIAREQSQVSHSLAEPEEYAAGEVMLPFSYSMTTSREPQPIGLNFRSQAGPDNCQVFVRIDDELWEFRSQWIVGLGTVARYKGLDIDQMERVDDGIYPDGMTACWFLGGMWYDAEEKKLYAPMHVEQDGERRVYTNLRKIALGTSTDKGRTWKYEGDIITAETYYYPHDAFKFSGNAFGNGVADFGFYVDERQGYFYVYPDEGWSLKTDRRGEMCWNSRVARCAISDKMAPGKWQYFYEGTWNQPALGGKSSSVSPGHLWGIVYSRVVDKYLCLFTANEDPPEGPNIDGIGIGCCSDLSKQDWVWGYCPDGMFGFLNLINANGTDVARICDDKFRFYSYFGPRDFCRMDVTVNKGETRAVNIGLRYLFQSHPESSDPILSRQTRVVPAGHSAATYSGNWSVVKPAESFDGTMHESSRAGATIEMLFTGTQVFWRAVRSPDSGRADFYIDGILRKSIDCYSPRSTTPKEFVYFHRRLSPGEHRVKVVVRGDKNPNSKGVFIRHVGFEYSAESYRASAGFSSVSGKNRWRYQQKTGTGFHDLVPVMDEASGTMYWSGTDHCRIGIDWQTADEHGSGRRWLAPRAGKVRVEGLVACAGGLTPLCSISVNDRQVWPDQAHLIYPAAHSLNLTVAPGDWITFAAVMSPECIAECRAHSQVSWDPTVTYLEPHSAPAVWMPNSRCNTNLALNKYARSRFLVSAYRPFDAVDGTLTHPFIIHADDPISTGEDWFMVDLEQPCMIDRYIVSFPSCRPRYVPRRFWLQRSDDAVNWADVDTVAKLEGKSGTALCIPLLRVDREVQPFRARYVRLYLPDGKPFALSGFELYYGKPG